jgi:hypothetical protein
MVNVVNEAGIPAWGGRLVLQIQAAFGSVSSSLATLSGVPSVLASSTSYANDAAAAAGGVKVGQYYRNGSVVQVRVS